MIRTRFAPSPTGNLHIGSLRTALFNFLLAKHEEGSFLLRIEDTDRIRSKKEFTEDIIESLKWAGLMPDEMPIFQSQRLNIYKSYAEKLIAEGKAYRCYCTKERLDKTKEEQKKRGERPHYDGHCRNIKQILDKPFVVRIKLPQEDIVFEDILRGEISFRYSEFDDFIIMKSDGSSMYNFANVIDDSEMGITHVVRGDDHLTNTARQIVLYRLLNLKVPQFIHIPLIMGEDKTRLSKRHGAKSVLEYRDEGYMKEALINYLSRLGWSYGDKEIFSLKELVKYFDIKHLHLSSAIFNPGKLLWLNEYYLRTLPSEEIYAYSKPFIETLFLKEDIKKQFSEVYVKKAMDTVRIRTQTLKTLAHDMLFYFKPPQDYEEKGVRKYCKKETLHSLEELYQNLKDLENFNIESIKDVFDKIIKKYDLKLIKIAQPVRIALTGKTISPGVLEMLEILGKDVSLPRIKRLIDYIKAWNEQN